jgi:hypothetical protein
MLEALSYRERKSLTALKFALGFFKANQIHGTFTEQTIRAAIKEYGVEHINEVDQDVLDSELSRIQPKQLNDIWAALEEQTSLRRTT